MKNCTQKQQHPQATGGPSKTFHCDRPVRVRVSTNVAGKYLFKKKKTHTLIGCLRQCRNASLVFTHYTHTFVTYDRRTQTLTSFKLSSIAHRLQWATMSHDFVIHYIFLVTIYSGITKALDFVAHCRCAFVTHQRSTAIASITPTCGEHTHSRRITLTYTRWHKEQSNATDALTIASE